MPVWMSRSFDSPSPRSDMREQILKIQDALEHKLEDSDISSLINTQFNSVVARFHQEMDLKLNATVDQI